MAIGTKHLTVLTPDQVRGIKSAMELLKDAETAVESAARGLPEVGFAAEKAKLQRSAEGLKWEWIAVDERLNELLDKGKKVGGCCSKCGCALPLGAAVCCYCGA